MTQREQWRDVPGYEGLYCVSNWGRVYSTYSRRYLASVAKDNGYFVVTLCIRRPQKSFYLHRLVASAFVPNPENKPQVNHKDGDKANNAADNLEWATESENQLHSRRVLNKWTGPPKKRVLCVETGATYQSTHEAARALSVCQGSVSNVCRGKQKTAGGYHFNFI